MKPLFVTLNGPIGCGKSWVVEQFMTGIESQHIHPINKTTVNFQHPLKLAARALLGVPGSVTYDDFKKTTYMGLTGREWMIRISEDLCKPILPTFFVELAINRVIAEHKKRDKSPYRLVCFCDSNGFEIEIAALRATSNIDLLACCIEPAGSAPRGEKWEANDSRFNLAHMCDLVALDSTAMLTKLSKALARRDVL